MDAKAEEIVNANFDANMNAKVESNMGPMVDVKLGTNCGETNLDATTDTKNDTNLDAK